MVVSSAIDLFMNILICSFAIWGIHGLIEEGRLLHHFGYYLERAQPGTRWWWKPIILCPQCMASVYGTLYSLYLGSSIGEWLLLVFAVSGLNFIIQEKW